jgi:hypothetical protein
MAYATASVAHALVRAASALMQTSVPSQTRCREESRHGTLKRAPRHFFGSHTLTTSLSIATASAAAPMKLPKGRWYSDAFLRVE